MVQSTDQDSNVEVLSTQELWRRIANAHLDYYKVGSTIQPGCVGMRTNALPTSGVVQPQSHEFKEDPQFDSACHGRISFPNIYRGNVNQPTTENTRNTLQIDNGPFNDITRLKRRGVGTAPFSGGGNLSNTFNSTNKQQPGQAEKTGGTLIETSKDRIDSEFKKPFKRGF